MSERVATCNCILVPSDYIVGVLKESIYNEALWALVAVTSYPHSRKCRLKAEAMNDCG